MAPLSLTMMGMERGTASWLGVRVLAMVVAIILFVPIALPAPEREPDLSFRATLQDAFAHHRQFGTEIVYSYGPWGLLQRAGSDARTQGATFVALLIVALLFAPALFMVVKDGGASAPAAALILAAAGALLAAGGADARFVSIPFLLIFSVLLAPRPMRELPLVGLCAFAGLIKLSYLAVGLFALAVMVAVRRKAWPVLAFGCVFVVSWVAAGQHLGGLPTFLSRGIEVVSGYSGAMGRAYDSNTELMSALAGVAGLVIAVAAIERSAIQTAAFAGAAYFTLQMGYVRYDDSHTPAAGALLLLLGLGYLLLRLRGRVLAGVACVALIVVLFADGTILLSMAGNDWRWLQGRDAKVAATRAEVAKLANAGALPVAVQGGGSIDSYTESSAALIVRGLDYAPRPAFQSYIAWSGSLAELNAAHLRGPLAPQWLWVYLTPIDENFPLAEDARSWLEILSRYDVESLAESHLLLRRRNHAVPFTRTAERTSRVRFGEEVALPDAKGDLLWCVIDAQPAPLTRLLSIVTRPPVLSLRIGGKPYRLPVAMARGGFILSPAVASTEDFAEVAALRSAAHRVTQIRVDGQGLLQRPFGDSFVLHLERIRFNQ
jgi:hypothetical protein